MWGWAQRSSNLPSSKLSTKKSVLFCGKFFQPGIRLYRKTKDRGSNFSFFIPMQIPTIPPEALTEKDVEFWVNECLGSTIRALICALGRKK